MKKLCILLFILFFINAVQAQVSVKKTSPVELQKLRRIKNNPTSNVVVMPIVDVKKAIDEDASNSSLGHIPRFGIKIKAQIDLNNGTWNQSDNGRVWSLEIKSDNAISLNLIFSEFYLAKGAELIVYNSSQDIVMGPFTNEYNNDTGVLGTDVIKGSSIILELFEPENQIGKSKLKISEVIHGYKDVQNNYGDAMGCNININCTQGSNWQTESNSVAMIIVNGDRSCSGVLLNNSCQDYTPNFLTAFHCLDTDSNGILSQQEMNSVQSWVFRFRYTSQSCNGPENLVFY